MKIKKVIAIFKTIGKTPLETIRELKAQFPLYQSAKIGYAGRLDPMAEGLLLLLTDEENKKKQTYENLTKTYEFDVLFGVETDTYDILGKITSASQLKDGNLKNTILALLPNLRGKFNQSYPPYSSMYVSGKPLFYWARQNLLHTVKIPIRQREIYSLALINVQLLSTGELSTLIKSRIAKVQGNFRQKEILKLWEDQFRENPNFIYPIATLKITCSSGTYIRSLAHHMGHKLRTSSLALSILRTEIGPFTLNKALTLS